jgi:hypothetical protein
LPRDGGWGFLAAGPFVLADDEAILVTLGTGGAAYTGFQILDPWMIAPDSRRNLTSRNNSQVTANADGSVTYVVAARDPGAANWLDTAGLHRGFVDLRWQGLPSGASGKDLVRDYRVVKIADLKTLLPAGPWRTPAERKAELSAHAAAFELRLGR